MGLIWIFEIYLNPEVLFWNCLVGFCFSSFRANGSCLMGLIARSVPMGSLWILEWLLEDHIALQLL